MKRSIAVILLVAFLVSFGAGYLMSIDTAGACKCTGRCVNCQPPCFCDRVGPCQCLTCVCYE